LSPERCSIVSNRTDPPKVILLFGPTGVGKTVLLERLFSRGAEVVSADALQVYKHLDIGTAKPDAGTLSRLPHHLINIIDYTESFSVGEFCRRADESIHDILSRGLLPVISGGTAYYLKAWLLGTPETPLVNPKIRRSLEEKWRGRDDESLRDEVMRLDPVSAGRIGGRDRYRMLRVLEVHAQTGRPLSDFKVPGEPRTDFRTLSIGLRRNRTELYRRIDERVEQMFRDGLASEAALLREKGARRNHPGMKAIGYREWFGEDGEETPDPERVKELIARNSRRYAKRQITFFASLPEVHWYDAGEDPDTPGGIKDTIRAFLDETASLDQQAPVGDNP
jgi:tRNA dimethylallyltransferase